MSLLEAMACGLPIISTDNDGSGDIISTGKNGYLFKVGDIEALAHFMEILCIDRNLRKDMGMSALDCIKTKYSWKKIAAQIREVYIS
jgi:glycosyltransferase involved in cell wall biosynthesis